VRSKAQFYNRLLSGIANSNPVEAMNVRLLVVAGYLVSSSHCYKLISISEESYRMCVCNCMWSRNLKSEEVYVEKNSKQDALYPTSRNLE